MPSTYLRDCDERLVHAYVDLLKDYRDENPGHDLVVTCTKRSVEEQQDLYAQGRTRPGQVVTQVDGVTKRSYHNYSPARAIDVAVTVNGKISWDPQAYAPLGPLAKRHGIVWGGDWPHFKDYPHLELPKENA